MVHFLVLLGQQLGVQWQLSEPELFNARFFSKTFIRSTGKTPPVVAADVFY